MEQIISNETIKQYLQTQGIDTTNINDNTITGIYNTYLNYILQQTGIQVEPTTATYTDINETKFNNKNYILPTCPINSIEEIIIDNKKIPTTQYITNLESGIIRWKTQQEGDTLQVTYTTQIDEETIQLITATILDLIYYNLDTNPSKDIKTLKEGDISITYDSDNSTANKINKNLETLKNLNNTIPKSKMIR